MKGETIYKTRPNFTEAFLNAASLVTDAGGLAIAACGPAPLVQDSRNAVACTFSYETSLAIGDVNYVSNSQ